ncbi:inositol phosphorylceramide synthase [Nocardioides silvaticus]|uniref:Inositol phosphorylceramide synthase n=1 Tax=Nocardioides silvaticus TaxID=2201891 RepID=A0A316TFU4_9ACTN|nr:phosphatase PAP2 family protein [Nocardioides silvaticus]PWN02039.1 inositol phosphorylceramide synthase [Nocardioides silvaticus]
MTLEADPEAQAAQSALSAQPAKSGATVTPARFDAVRVLGILTYAVGLAAYMYFGGLPRQGYQVVIILWLATVAWDVRRPVQEHLAFIRDWWPPFLVLLVYLYSRGISDDLGIFSVHFTEPIEADRWLFGGTLPTEFLQQHLCGVPCRQSLTPAWYDVVLTTVYYSHFFAALAIGAFLWKRNRDEWVYYMRRYLTIISLSVVCYMVYPMAPPWMAARDGYLTDDVARITGRGWFDLTASASSTDTAHQNVSAIGNQVAAMPSLHSALAIFIAWWVIARFTNPWRWTVLLYPASMLFSLVYYAEHYVVDEIAGGLLVALVLPCWAWWERRRRQRFSTT